MDENKTSGNLIAYGYQFVSEEDATRAQTDASKINLLNSKVKTDKPAEIKAVYEKAIENKIFKTPVGWEYLTDLRKKMISMGINEDDIIPIPVDVSFTRHSALENLTVKQRIKPLNDKADFARIFSLVLNVALIIVVIVMFIIAMTSDNDNILNYKSNITNRYASWEQDLKEREAAVREAEKKLGIADSSSYYDSTD